MSLPQQGRIASTSHARALPHPSFCRRPSGPAQVDRQNGQHDDWRGRQQPVQPFNGNQAVLHGVHPCSGASTWLDSPTGCQLRSILFTRTVRDAVCAAPHPTLHLTGDTHLACRRVSLVHPDHSCPVAALPSGSVPTVLRSKSPGDRGHGVNRQVHGTPTPSARWSMPPRNPGALQSAPPGDSMPACRHSQTAPDAPQR